MDGPDSLASGLVDPAAQPLSVRLRQLLELTGVALTHLALDDLLSELLVRVRELLRVDTAGILLLEESAEPVLVPRVAKGLGEKVGGGMRVPLGEGFVGRVALEGRPVVVEDVELSKFVDPVFGEQGVRSLIGVPLRADGSLVGVLHVGTRTPRSFDPADIDLLELVGNRAALAIERAGLFESKRAAQEQAEAASVRLGQLLALNGLVLTHLTLDDLLSELLVRVRELLRDRYGGDPSARRDWRAGAGSACCHGFG